MVKSNVKILSFLFILTLFVIGILFYPIKTNSSNTSSSLDELQKELIASKLNLEPSKLTIQFDPVERKSYVIHNNVEYVFQYDLKNNTLNLISSHIME